MRIGLEWRDKHVDCPKSGPGPVQSFFAGPGPGPLGPGRHVLDLDLDLSGPGPGGLGQVRSRSGTGPHGKMLTIFFLQSLYGTSKKNPPAEELKKACGNSVGPTLAFVSLRWPYVASQPL